MVAALRCSDNDEPTQDHQCLFATLLQISCLRTSHSSSFMGNRSFGPLHGSEYLCPPHHIISFSACNEHVIVKLNWKRRK